MRSFLLISSLLFSAQLFAYEIQSFVGSYEISAAESHSKCGRGLVRVELGPDGKEIFLFSEQNQISDKFETANSKTESVLEGKMPLLQRLEQSFDGKTFKRKETIEGIFFAIPVRTTSHASFSLYSDGSAFYIGKNEGEQEIRCRLSRVITSSL